MSKTQPEERTMQFRLGTYISTLAMAFLIYAGMVTIVIRKIELQIVIPCFGIQASQPPPTVQEHGIAFYGISNLCALWLAGHVILYIRRRTNRHRLGFCQCCGYRLTMDLHRCLRCGEKRPLFGSSESLFPVIMPDRK
jgi:hypothetical protein